MSIRNSSNNNNRNNSSSNKKTNHNEQEEAEEEQKKRSAYALREKQRQKNVNANGNAYISKNTKFPRSARCPRSTLDRLHQLAATGAANVRQINFENSR